MKHFMLQTLMKFMFQQKVHRFLLVESGGLMQGHLAVAKI